MSARVIQVIEVIANRGNGTEENPHRRVFEYWSFDGQLLAVNDEWINEKLILSDNL